MQSMMRCSALGARSIRVQSSFISRSGFVSEPFPRLKEAVRKSSACDRRNLRCLQTSPAHNLDAAGNKSTEAVRECPSRCFAIVAHVDHGKTTLVDKLLEQAGDSVAEERIMDAMDLEKERGITIASKVTSLNWRGHTLFAVDTPGHADFGGEVERVLDMVDGCLLVVDAHEGPLAQTKFVLSKALAKGLQPLIVLNKVDRETASERRCNEVEAELFDLFASSGASDEQLDFKTVYASAKQGWAALSYSEARRMMEAGEAGVASLLDTIIEQIPPPDAAVDSPFSMLVSMIEWDSYVGEILTGKVMSGVAKVGTPLHALSMTGEKRGDVAKVSKIYMRQGMKRIEVTQASAGQIVSIAGISAGVTDTLSDPACNTPLTTSPIDPPTLKMNLGINTAPLVGKEGTIVNPTQLEARLQLEIKTNVALKVDFAGSSSESFEVQGRGEMHLGVLIETMRREGFELSVSPPRVVYRDDGEGEVMEPIEEVMLQVDSDDVGTIVEAMNARKGDLIAMQPSEHSPTHTCLSYTVPSRALIGFRSDFQRWTRGEGIMTQRFLEYQLQKGALGNTRPGVMISMADGVATGHALAALEERGQLFIEPGQQVYAGMIIGECAKQQDLEVNPTKLKKLTNMRNTGSEEQVRLSPPRLMTLEEAMGYIQPDELVEVTPKSIRLRKRELDATKRKTDARKAKEDFQ